MFVTLQAMQDGVFREADVTVTCRGVYDDVYGVDDVDEAFRSEGEYGGVGVATPQVHNVSDDSVVSCRGCCPERLRDHDVAGEVVLYMSW